MVAVDAGSLVCLVPENCTGAEEISFPFSTVIMHSANRLGPPNRGLLARFRSVAHDSELGVSAKSLSSPAPKNSVWILGMYQISHPEMTCKLSRPLRRSMWSGDQVEKSPHELKGASGVSVPFVR